MSAATAAAAACLTLDNVTVAYGGRPALESVTLSVPHGAQVAIVGPNGAGKSTLFKALVGLLPVRSGRIDAARPRARRARGHDRVRAPARGDRLELPGDRARRRHDGPVRPPGLVPPARGGRPRGRGALPGRARHRRPREARHRRTLRRPAAARVPGPRARPGAARPAPGRALHRRRPQRARGAAHAPRAPAPPGHHRAGEHPRHADGGPALRARRPAEPPADRLRRAGRRLHRGAPGRGVRRPGAVPGRHGRDRPVLLGPVGDGEEHRHSHGPHAEPR